MEFSGDQLIRKRNFYTQNGNFGVIVDFSVTDPSGRYEFGISGTQKVSICLESGQIKYNDLFVQSYLPFNEYSLLLEVTDNKLNYIQNNIEIAYDLQKQTGNYDFFFFQRDNTGINAEFDFYLSGKNLPVYQIDKIGYLFDSGQRIVSGAFSNSSGYNINIFDSVAQGIQNLTFGKITGVIQSGGVQNFYYSGDFLNFDFSQSILTNFYTNFGFQGVNFKIIDTTTLEKFILFNSIDDFSFNENNEINRNLKYFNYSGNVSSDIFNTEISVNLSYINGSGDFTVEDFASSASFTGFAYGNFLESGLVTGTSFVQTGNESITGRYRVDFTRFQWATGLVTGYSTGFGYGTASGYNYTGLAYGEFSSVLTATISNGSGSFIFDNVIATGNLINSGSAIGYTGYINSTGYINLSGVPDDGAFYIGIESIPIVKGLQYANETGLVYYLSGQLSHGVKAHFDGSLVLLESLRSGSLGDGTFIRNYECNPALSFYSEFLTGGTNIGETGFAVFSSNPFSGAVSLTATGSGDYRQYVSGNEPGNFIFTRTFTGSWEILTGIEQDSLIKVPYLNEENYSGFAILPPNQSIIFQINHSDSEFNEESANLIITGNLVLNSINQIITQ